MTTTVSRSRPRQRRAFRRAGYLASAAVNALVLFAINAWPGWREVPFLTEDTPQVLGLVNLSLAVVIAVNAVYVAADPLWLTSLGDLVTTSVGLAVLIRMWRVFPFDFTGYSVDWAMIIRIVLIVATVGAAIGILAQAALLVRRLVDLGSEGDDRPHRIAQSRH